MKSENVTIKKEYCPNCFNAIGSMRPCPYCGNEQFDRKNPLALPVNVVLKNRYVVGRMLGAGGFGITYKCYDLKERKICAIKEYAPSTSATRLSDSLTLTATSVSRQEIFEHGREKFLGEAATLSKLQDIPDVVKIWDCFEMNGTAYFVMEFLSGSTLNGIKKAYGGRIEYSVAYGIILQAAESLGKIHEEGNIFHRDISPENIMVTADLEVKIIDFGTAKYINNQKSQTLSVVLKPGYAPPEQYSTTSKQGAFTDVYALASTFYYVITGKKIPAAPDRLVNEDFVPLEDYDFLGEQYAGLTLVLKDALRTSVKKRIQTMEEFASRLKSFHSSITGQKSDSSFVHSEERTVLDEGDGKKRDNKKSESPKKITRIYPYLEGKTDPIYGYRYYIPLNTMVTVGRSKESNIVINMGVIGRKHLEVFYDTDSGLFFLMDNHSVNHTYINNKLCEPEVIYPVKPGNYLRLAGNSCVFQLGVVNEEYRG